MKYAEAWEELKTTLKYSEIAGTILAPERVLRWMDELEEEYE